MNIKNFAIVSILMLYGSSYCIGQRLSLKFNHLTKDDGLPSGIVNCIFQDSKGYMWFGTMDGLCRYDGHAFTYYRHRPNDNTSLSDNFITAIAEDSRGKIWIGTNLSGVSVLDYKTGKFTRFNNKAEEGYRIQGNSIKDIYIDEEDNVLIASGGDGLDIFHQKTRSFSYYQSNPEDPNSLQGNKLGNIQKKSEGQFFVSNATGGIDLLEVNTGKITHVTRNKDYERNASNWRPLLHDSKGNLWTGGSNGAIKHDPVTNKKSAYTIQNGLTSNIVSTLFEDKNGRIWIGTDGGGLNVLDPLANTLDYFKHDIFDNYSLSTNPVTAIYEDRGGTIWVATHSGGLNSYNPEREKFKTYRQLPGNPNSLNANLVLAFHEGTNKKIWIGTDGGGLNLFDPKTDRFTHYKHSPTNSNSPGSNVIPAIYEDRNGIIWLGSYAGGLTSFNPSTGRFTRYFNDPSDNTSIAGNSVWAIAEDSQNNLIIGLLGQGVDVFDREKGVFTHYKTKVEDNTTLLGNFIRFIFEDSKQNVWIGTEIGLNRFDISSGTFERYRSIREDSTTLSGKDVRTISESGRGNLWFGTTSGVSLYDPPSNSFIRHEVNSKLPSIVVNGILEDDVGNLWISTNEGLSRYNLDSKDIENFKKTDGLQGMEFSARAAIKSRYGNYMFFGGTNGMNMFNPSSIGRSDKEVGVVFSEIRLFDEPINQGDTVNGRVLLEKDLSITKEITLTHEENVLALAFSALDYTAPDKNLFAYKLGGFDEDETVVDARNRKITYTNLDPGHYTFQVKASNHDGLFSSDNYIEMGIIVLPPWWQTWWFRILLVITVISLIYFIANWRFRILNNQKRVLQDEVDKHTGKLKEVIEILRLKSNQISTSGFNLKQKSGMLAEDARLQTESAKRIEGSIEVVINHTRKNTENAVKTNNISENTVRELARIREANEENLNENRIISSKIEALEEIFKQTNILAINAAIQAARAGTYGSGFSIIANEVKKLAERSRVASFEISGSAQNGSNKTEEMERLLIDFVPEIEKSVNLIKEISQSSKEQTNSVDVMTQSLREFFNISRKNAEISSEIHVISSELDELAKYLNDQVQNIRL